MDGCLSKVEDNGQIEWLGNGCGTGMHSVTSATKTTFVSLLTVHYPSILKMRRVINQEYSVEDFFGTGAVYGLWWERNHWVFQKEAADADQIVG